MAEVDEVYTLYGVFRGFEEICFAPSRQAAKRVVMAAKPLFQINLAVDRPLKSKAALRHGTPCWRLGATNLKRVVYTEGWVGSDRSHRSRGGKSDEE